MLPARREFKKFFLNLYIYIYIYIYNFIFDYRHSLTYFLLKSLIIMLFFFFSSSDSWSNMPPVIWVFPLKRAWAATFHIWIHPNSNMALLVNGDQQWEKSKSYLDIYLGLDISFCLYWVFFVFFFYQKTIGNLLFLRVLWLVNSC